MMSKFRQNQPYVIGCSLVKIECEGISYIAPFFCQITYRIAYLLTYSTIICQSPRHGGGRQTQFVSNVSDPGTILVQNISVCKVIDPKNHDGPIGASKQVHFITTISICNVEFTNHLTGFN